MSDLSLAAGEKTPWASTMRTCRPMLAVAPALWTLLAVPSPESTTISLRRLWKTKPIRAKMPV